MQLDSDIEALDLTDIEKNGLQVYRNYERSFHQHRTDSFRKAIDDQTFVDISRLEKVLDSIAMDETRLIPVICCAFIDDIMDEMFKREIPQGVPGGRDSLFSGYGPLSSLSRRVQIAYSFGWLSPDVLIDIDAVRKIRNKLSHAWDHELLSDYFSKPPISTMTAIEKHFGPHEERLSFKGADELDAQGRFRVRLTWVVGRAFYESLIFVPALKEGLNINQALYSETPPKLLSKVSGACSEGTRKILRKYLAAKEDPASAEHP